MSSKEEPASIKKIAYVLLGIENMTVNFIRKPYKIFIISTVKLCLVFSLIVYLSFNPVLFLAFIAVYIVIFYYTYIFIKFCSKFGYKKIMCYLVFIILYFLCYLGTVNLRQFLSFLYFN